jgi:hypothetical protein
MPGRSQPVPQPWDIMMHWQLGDCGKLRQQHRPVYLQANGACYN